MPQRLETFKIAKKCSAEKYVNKYILRKFEVGDKKLALY